MSALYPNVPLAIAGVPAVLRRAGALADAQEQIATAQRDVGNPARWGIFTTAGVIALEADNVVSVEHNAEYQIAGYPVEGGSFESYDKVATPFGIRIALTKGGTVEERGQFLIAAQALLESFDTYDVVTPERVYLNVNATRIARTVNSSNGAGLASVEMVFQEVRTAAKAAYSRTDTAPDLVVAPVAPTPSVSAAPRTTRRPAAARKVNQGAVQPKRVVISGATLTTTASGRKLYVYDRPPGSR